MRGMRRRLGRVCDLLEHAALVERERLPADASDLTVAVVDLRAAWWSALGRIVR